MEFNQVEREFLVKIISQLQISPANADASKVIEIVQSILKKLNPDK